MTREEQAAHCVPTPAAHALEATAHLLESVGIFQLITGPEAIRSRRVVIELITHIGLLTRNAVQEHAKAVVAWHIKKFQLAENTLISLGQFQGARWVIHKEMADMFCEAVSQHEAVRNVLPKRVYLQQEAHGGT
jgi:hypothetical protein